MNRLSVVISAGLLAAAHAMSQGVSLGLAAGSGSPGATVSIDLNLTDPASDLPASLEWTLNYSTVDFSSATFSAGAAGSGASKSLLCNSTAAGSVTCILAGPNAATIGSGAVATLSLVIANSTTDPSSALQLSGSNASDATGSTLPVSVTGSVVTITPLALNGFSCNPASITPPATATCNIALTGPAPTGGASITMSASPADISFPAVVISAGTTSTTFSIGGSTVVTSTPVTLTASYAGVNSTFPFTVLAAGGALSSVTAPASVVSGQTGSGTVTLTSAAPSGGAVVSLSSSNTSAASVPSSVTVAAGSASATFTITAGAVSAATGVTFTASYSGATATASTTINPAPVVLSSLAVSPTTIASGQSATGTVTLAAAAPSGGAVVSLSSSNTSAATVPVNVTVPAGATSATFAVTAATVSAAASMTLTATIGSSSVATSLTVNPAAPVISSATSATAMTGTAFSYQIAASNSPTGYNATGLPAGLSVNTSSGLISGTPTAAGSSSISLSATNSGGTGTATLALTVHLPAPVISSATTATATAGTSFSYQITASNSPSSYNATGLPAGLAVNTSSGLISGTPSAAGSSTITLKATNTSGTGTASLSLTINPATQTAPPAPVITSATTASGTAGAAFSYQITASNSPTGYSATGLPSGLSLNASSGLISGTPAAAGTSTITLGATNSGGTGHATLTLTVTASSAAISFVQATARANTSNSKSLAVSFSRSTVAGDIVMVGFDFDAAVSATITDSQGNTFTQVGRQLVSSGGTRTQVYYAQNIKGGAEKVTITLSAKATVIECYLAEYSGVSQTSPIDAQAGASGTASAISSGSVTTTVAGDLIYGYSVCDSACTAGSGFTARETLDSNLVEDKLALAPGSYAATGTANSPWTMQLVALKHQ